MRIGVVSDTHNNLANVARIVELFNAAGVERVVHTGDITQARTIEVFARLHMPMVGVFGNNDQDERSALMPAIAAAGFEFHQPPFDLVWHARRIVVVHDPLEFVGSSIEDAQLALHGHTHRQRIERDAQRLVFNPGECAGHMKGYNTVGVVDLATLDIELLRF